MHLPVHVLVRLVLGGAVRQLPALQLQAALPDGPLLRCDGAGAFSHLLYRLLSPCPAVSSCIPPSPTLPPPVSRGRAQIFGGLLPPGTADSPFHFRSRHVWRCSRACCGYKFESSSLTEHLPLLLGVADVSLLLAAGVPAEVGALTAAHFSRAPYDYGECPQCGRGALDFRPTQPRYSPLLLVELARDGGVVGGRSSVRLPWSLGVAPRMALEVGGVPVEYEAAAVVYNDASHWWADLLSGGHFRRERPEAGLERGTVAYQRAKRSRCAPLGRSSYRYDGMEEGGRLRFTGHPRLVMTSEARHISFVLYRRLGAAASAAARPDGGGAD